jgi:hypothetical protein
MYLTLLILYNIILLDVLERMFLLSYNTYSLYVIGLYNYSYNTVFNMLYYIIVCVNNTQGYDVFFIAGEKKTKLLRK